MWHEAIMEGVLGLGALIVGIWIVKMTRDPEIEFNAMRLLMRKDQDGMWRESRRAIGELVAIGVSTWGFVFLVVGGKLTEWYMGAWMGILLGWTVAKKLTEKNNGNRSELSDK